MRRYLNRSIGTERVYGTSRQNRLKLVDCELPQPEPSEKEIEEHFHGTPYGRECKALILRLHGLSLREIGEEFGVKEQAARMLIFRATLKLRKPIDKNPMRFLSGRAWNALRSNQFRDKDSVKRGILEGRIFPNFTPLYGPRTHEEVCNWCGVPAPQPADQSPNPATVEKYKRYLERYGYKVLSPSEAKA